MGVAYNDVRDYDRGRLGRAYGDIGDYDRGRLGRAYSNMGDYDYGLKAYNVGLCWWLRDPCLERGH